MSAVLEFRRHKFNRAQYERIVDAGIFGPEDRLELLNGEIMDMAPQKSRHATAVTLAGDVLRSAFGPDVTVRLQLPFALDDHSEPEPDVAVVPGKPRDYSDGHPVRALRDCEVSATTLAYDQGAKLAAYARAEIPDYWILDLVAEVLEVYRKPEHGAYRERQILSAGGQVAPLAGYGRTVAVRALLP